MTITNIASMKAHEQQASEFVGLVKRELLGGNQPQRYLEFLSLLEEPRAEHINAIINLLDGHESLIIGFNQFLSPKFQVPPVDLKKKLYHQSTRTFKMLSTIEHEDKEPCRPNHHQECSTISVDTGVNSKLPSSQTHESDDRNAREDEQCMCLSNPPAVTKHEFSRQPFEAPHSPGKTICHEFSKGDCSSINSGKRPRGSSDEIYDHDVPKVKKVRFVTFNI